MTKQGNVNLWPDQQGVAEQRDMAGFDRAYAGVSLNPNVTATVTSEPDLTSTSQRALPDGRSGETGGVRLCGTDIGLDSEPAKKFITDCARNTEGLLSDLEIQTRYGLSNEDWKGLATNFHLLNAVRAERDRRVLSGEAAREAAQRHFAKAPNVLGEILADEQMPPRHRIEAAKELRQAAFSAPANASGPVERFVINIDLGGDEKLVFEKEIARRTPSLPDDGE
jgi:hypothetical protein